jgi:hypothetical protein
MVPAPDDVEKIIDRDILFKKLREGVLNGLKDYGKSIKFMTCDAPLSILCIPKKIEKVLSKNGIIRIYDLLYTDLTKIELLSVSDIRDLTSRLDQFLAML